MSNFWITKKDLNYSLDIRILDNDKNTTTKREINKVKQELENALLLYFTTPTYPKKIREAKSPKDADVYVIVFLKKFEDFGEIYVANIDISFKATYPLVFRESFPFALNRKTEFDAFIEYFVNSIIKRTSNEIFQITNEDLPLNLNLEDYIIER
ncbi:hypothetical protein [uncultured Helicobacter sp.]|uniref:hypothetical protein n=1 Tax=uncultured Helicobacter sp. TaxID=175537 RepID=UPI00262AFDB0|nr:hypothetical protein [uncultured Helicobacter sp.]